MDRSPTIHDVARALGMHKSTVSLALSGKGNVSRATRERITTVAREMGYEPNPLARRLANGWTNDTVYIFSGHLDVGLATAKILRVQEALNARSLDAPIYNCIDVRDAPEQLARAQVAQIRQLCRQRPRAIVCFAHLLEPAVFRELEAYQRAGGILVTFDHPTPLNCDQVIFDREDNAYQAAAFLLENGHRRLGLRMAAQHPGSGSVTVSDPQELRFRGFRRALAEYDAPFREEWVFPITSYETGGAELARRYLEQEDRPTGLCIVNDYVALGFMVEVMQAGLRVPGDVSIIAHDDQPVAAFCPVPLTAATQPVDRIADAVVDLLMTRLEGNADPEPRRVIIRGEVVVRQSVAAPPVQPPPPVRFVGSAERTLKKIWRKPVSDEKSVV
jgi:LacI family transcriptional regulator